MTSSLSRILPALALLPFMAASAVAQSGPPIPTMPMPPSASDPAPKDGAKAKAKPKRAERKASGEGAAVAEAGSKPAGKSRRATSSGDGDGYERPSRYVPEEFDQGGGSGGGSVKPFMGEGGRAGMGMKF